MAGPFSSGKSIEELDPTFAANAKLKKYPESRQTALQFPAGLIELPLSPLYLYGIAGYGLERLTDQLPDPWEGFKRPPEGERGLPGYKAVVERASAWSDLINRAFGIEEPQNVGQMVLRMLPGAIPTPMTGGGTVKNVIRDVFVPTTTTRGPIAPILNVGVPVAISEGIEAYDPSPEYKSALEELSGLFRAKTAVSAEELTKHLRELEEQQFDQKNRQDAMLIAVGGMLSLGGMSVLIGKKLLGHYDPQEAIHSTPRSQNQILKGTDKAVSYWFDKNRAIVGAAEHAQGKALPDFENLVRLGANPTQLSQAISHTIATGEFSIPVISGTPGTAGVRILKIPSLIKLSKELSLLPQAEKDGFLQYMTALDELDNRKMGFAKTGYHVRPHMPGLSDTDLRTWVANGKRNPKILHYAQQYRQVFDGILEYKVARGEIKPELAKKWKAAHPNFIPLGQSFEREGWFKRHLREVFEHPKQIDHLKQVDSLLSRDVMLDSRPSLDRGVRIPVTATIKGKPVTLRPSETGIGTPNPKTGELESALLPVPVTAINYAEQMLRGSLRNQILKDFAKYIETGKVKIPGIRLTKSVSDKTVAFMDKGKLRFIHIDDDYVRNAALFMPQHVIPVMNAARKWSQFWMTGPGNPWYALKSAYWDITNAPLLKGPNRKLGYIEKALGTGKLGIYDPTFLLSVPVGVLRHLKADIASAVQQTFESAMNVSNLSGRNVGVQRLFGPGATQKIARVAANAYANSYLKLFESQGGAGYRFGTERDVIKARDIIRKYAPSFYGNSRLASAFVRAYSAVLDAVHNGTKLQYVALNYKSGMTQKELLGLVNEARQLGGGDIARHGAGRVTGAITSTFNYSNVSLQELYQTGKMLKEHPFYAIPQMMFWPAIRVALLVRAYQLGQEYVDHYFNDRSPEERVNNMAWYHEGKAPRAFLPIPVPPIYRVPLAVTDSVVDAIFGFSSGVLRKNPEMARILADMNDTGVVHVPPFGYAQVPGSQRVWDKLSEDVKAGLSSYLGISTPMIVQAPLALVAGKRFNLSTDPSQIITDVKSEQISGSITPKRYADDLFGANYHASMSSVFAAFYAAMHQSIRDATLMYKGTDDFGKALETGIDTFVKKNVGQAPFLGHLIWGETVPDATYNTDRRLVQDKLEAVDKLKQFFARQQAAGVVAKSRPQNLQGFKTEPLTDPVRMQMLSWLVGAVEFATKDSREKIGNSLRQIDSIESDSHLTPQERVKEANKHRFIINQETEYMLYQMYSFEDQLSDALGEQVTIESLTDRY